MENKPMASKTFREFLFELSPAMMAQADVARAQDLYGKAGRSPARQLRMAKQDYIQKPDPNEVPAVKTARMKIMRAKKMLVQAEMELKKAQEKAASEKTGAPAAQTTGTTGTGS